MSIDTSISAVYTLPMSNTPGPRYDKSFLIRTDQAFLDMVDRLRAEHAPALTRADMIRKLVIEADRKAKRGRQ